MKNDQLIETLQRAYALVEALGDDKEVISTLNALDDEMAIASGETTRDELAAHNALRSEFAAMPIDTLEMIIRYPRTREVGELAANIRDEKLGELAAQRGEFE